MKTISKKVRNITKYQKLKYPILLAQTKKHKSINYCILQNKTLKKNSITIYFNSFTDRYTYDDEQFIDLQWSFM